MLELDDLIKVYEKLPSDKREEIDKLIGEDYDQVPWRPLIDLKNPEQPTPQQQAADCQADILLYGGAMYGGKGQPTTKQVLTPFGWRRIGDLKVGSSICATDGTVQRIIGYYPRGKQPMYKLKWHDGSETICDEDHIWLMWKSGGSRKIGGKRTCGEASSQKWTTKQIFNYYSDDINSRDRKIKLSIPVISKPCAFNVAGQKKGPYKFIKRSIPAYILGVLIGDGSIGPAISFTSDDPEIPERIEEIIASEYVSDSIDEKENDFKLKSSFVAKGTCRTYRIPMRLMSDDLKDLGLWRSRSNNKFIPRIYLFGTVEERWELMRGLMDTDGWADEDGDCYYTTISKQLAQDVRHLARSLGAITSIQNKNPTYAYKGEKRSGRPAYCVRIKIPNPEKLFHLERKKEICAGSVNRYMGIRLESIEPCGNEETVCIAVSHPNSLYIIDDFIVTHNSNLICGLAVTRHQRSMIYRREKGDLQPIADEIVKIRKTRKGYNGQLKRFIWTEGGREKNIRLGGMQYEADKEKYKGDDRDLIAFDELRDFLESQFRFVIAWNRSPDPNQRCRVVCTTNPPNTAEGDWIIKFWAPWLDPEYPNPALPGELRWFISDEQGNDLEVPGPEPIMVKGVMMSPRSRTFIPSSVDDNPYASKAYKANLQALPEPLRSQMLMGDFMAGREDDMWQVIPTDWVRQAQERWTKDRPVGIEMSALGVDPSRGGKDDFVLTPRYGWWFGEQVVVKGHEVEDGPSGAALCTKYAKDGCSINVDIIGGAGTSVYDHLRTNGANVQAIDSRMVSYARDITGSLGFFNKRSENWWRMREALDPNGNERIALPPSTLLRADLCAPRWRLTGRGIQVEGKYSESKDGFGGLNERLGRSTDLGDSCVNAWVEGKKIEKKRKGHVGARANSRYSPIKRFRR